jgi:hypothetical protein
MYLKNAIYTKIKMEMLSMMNASCMDIIKVQMINTNLFRTQSQNQQIHLWNMKKDGKILSEYLHIHMLN